MKNLFIASVVAAGVTVLELGLYRWSSPQPLRFAVFFLFALIAATRKIRLPFLTTTVSPSFLFVLIGIVDFSLSQCLVLGCAATLVQCIWKPSQRPTYVQLAFNVGSWAVSIGAAYWLAHLLSRSAGAPASIILLMSLGACVFFVIHIGLLAIVLSLAERKRLQGVWQDCSSTVLPFYLVGTGIGALICVLTRTVGWPTSLLLLPAMYVVYLCYLPRVQRAEPMQV